ncbi:MAG: permease [Dehalococcoidales bacterium]
MFRKPNKKEVVYLLLVLVSAVSAVSYVYANDLSAFALFRYGLLQPQGITGEEVKIAEIDTPLSWNIPQVIWFIYIKGAAVLTELLPYWLVGMLIAGTLMTFVPWEKVKKRLGYGSLGSNALAGACGSIVPICSCGIVPVLAGMVQAGIPLGPTMAFLIMAPMANIPTVIVTAGILGWKLAIARVLGGFAIALGVSSVLSYWQSKERFLRRFIKLNVAPSLPPALQQFAFQTAITLSKSSKLPANTLAPGQEEKLYLLAEAGILDRDKEGMWHLPQTKGFSSAGTAACFALPTGDANLTFRQGLKKTVSTGWDFFLQLNYYLVMAMLIAGAIKVLIPTSVIVNFVGGESLNSVIVAAGVAVVAYVCTYVEVPTALALIHKGMGGGATLAYLLGGPGLSLPSWVLLSGVFKLRVLVLYIVLSFLGCVIAGYLFNLL